MLKISVIVQSDRPGKQQLRMDYVLPEPEAAELHRHRPDEFTSPVGIYEYDRACKRQSVFIEMLKSNFALAFVRAFEEEFEHGGR
jgi:hypothetical protein